MKKIGLIGGIGPESTLLYYKKLVYELQREVGPTFFPHLAIESLNVFDVLAFIFEPNVKLPEAKGGLPTKVADPAGDCPLISFHVVPEPP